MKMMNGQCCLWCSTTMMRGLRSVPRGAGTHWLAGAVVVLGVLTAAGATIRDDQPGSAYLNLALTSDYGAVGTFVNSWGYSGSATLIAPDWVLTGAHMFTAASSGTFTINGTAYGTTQLISHSKWNSANKLAGYDFGLAHLSNPVAGVAPAQLYVGNVEFGQTATFVGFGLTGTGLTGYRTLDNRKRAFQNVVDGDFGTPAVLYGTDFDNPHSVADNWWGDAAPLTLEGCAAPGDSGGGVFLTFGGSTYLAGVISLVAALDGSANSDYGDLTGFGRVSAVAPWIVSIVPEPSSGILLLGGLGLVGWLRNRRGVADATRA